MNINTISILKPRLFGKKINLILKNSNSFNYPEKFFLFVIKIPEYFMEII